MFAEDPIFVCEVAQSLVEAADSKRGGGRKSVKEKQKLLAQTWSKLLEVTIELNVNLSLIVSQFFFDTHGRDI